MFLVHAVSPGRPGILALVLALSLLLGMQWLATAPAAEAAGAAVVEAPVIDRAGQEADDPLHVSDESFAVAIFVPAIFLAATGLTVAIAMAKRGRDGSEDEDD